MYISTLLGLIITQSSVQSAGNAVEAPIWVASWSTVPRDVSAIVPMVRVEGDFRPGGDNPSLNPESYADRLKQLPRGRRVLFWARYSHSFWVQGTDSLRSPAGEPLIADPASPKAVEVVSTEWRRFLELIKFCGTEVDHLVGDNEDWGKFKSWSIKEEDFKAMCSLQEAPNTPPLKAPCDSEFLQIQRPGSPAHVAWNLCISGRSAQTMIAAIWLPAIAVFPGLTGSNFDGVRTLDRPSPDLNGHAQPWDNIVGNRAAPSIYGQVQQVADAWFIDDKDPSGLSREGSIRLSRGPWSSLLIDVQQLRAVRRGSLGQPLTPWIAPRTYSGDVPGSVGYPNDPRYYLELLRHAALSGTEYFLWWNTRVFPPGSRSGGPSLDELAIELNGWIEGINHDLHGKVIECISTEPESFNTKVLLTGAKCADGLVRWRATVRPEVRALRDRSSGTIIPIPPAEVGVWITRQMSDPRPDLDVQP